MEQLDKDIPALEKQKAALEQQLASGISDFAEIQKISQELKTIGETLDEKSMRWLEIHEEL